MAEIEFSGQSSTRRYHTGECFAYVNLVDGSFNSLTLGVRQSGTKDLLLFTRQQVIQVRNLLNHLLDNDLLDEPSPVQGHSCYKRG